MKYQCFTFLPWWFQRYVLFNKNAVLPPLYHFDSAERVASDSELEQSTSGKGQTRLVENTTEVDAREQRL